MARAEAARGMLAGSPRSVANCRERQPILPAGLLALEMRGWRS